MEVKWICICFALVMGAVAVGDAVHKYSANQCRIAYATSGKTATDIAEICK
jgi:hypothetical protein